MSDPVAAAVRGAERHGVPFVYRAGTLVVLVLAGQGAKTLRAEFLTWNCKNAGLARAVERTAITNLRQFPGRNPLEVSALYAEAAWRHACRRAGRA